MKTNAQIQADYKRRQRESGNVQKTIWIHPDDWPEINLLIFKKNKIRVDLITGNDKVSTD